MKQEHKPLPPVSQLPDRYVLKDAAGKVIHDVDLRVERKRHAARRKYRRT